MTKSREEKWKGWPKTAPSAPSSFDDKPRSTYEPLTQQRIDELEAVILADRENWPSKAYGSEVRRLCAMAGNSLLYGEEIQRLRDLRSAIAEPCQRLGCRYDVAQSMLDRAKEYGELSEEERRAMTNPESATRVGEIRAALEKIEPLIEAAHKSAVNKAVYLPLQEALQAVREALAASPINSATSDGLREGMERAADDAEAKARSL